MNYFAIPGLPTPDKSKEKTIEAVAKVFNVGIKEMLSNSRERALVDARRALVHILHKQGKFTVVAIGKIIGRHHSSTIYHKKEAENLIQTDADFREKINKLIYLYI